MTPDLLADFALVIGAAAVAALICARLRAPRALGHLFAGMAIGPHGLPPLAVQDPDVVAGFSDIGVAVLMFAVGLEFSLGQLRAAVPVSGLVGVLELLVALAAGWLTGRALGWGPVQCASAAALLAATSTAIAVGNLHERGWARREVGPLLYGVLLVEDVLMVLVLAVLGSLAAAGGAEPGAVLAAALRLVAITAAVVVLGRRAVPALVRYVRLRAGREALVLATVGAALGAAALARAAGFPVVLGAFLGGALVAESGLARDVERQVAPVRDLLVPIFFVSVGMAIDPAALLAQAGTILPLAAAAIAAKLGGGLFAALASGTPPRTAALLALHLVPLGEFSFIVAGLLVDARVPGPSWPALALGLSLITATVGALLVRPAGRLAAEVERRMPEALRTFLQSYGIAVRRLGRRRARPRAPAALRRVAGHVLVEAVAIVALLWLARPVARWLVPRLGRKEVQEWPETAFWAGALVLALPFAIGLLRSLRALAMILAEQATGGPEAARPGPAGRALTLAFQLVLTLAVGLLLLLATAPVLPPAGTALAIGAGVAVIGALLGRAMVRLHTRVRLAVRRLALAGPPERAAAEEALAAALREAWEHEVACTEVTLPGAAPAVGRSLGDLDLPATGVAVVALRREGRPIVPPGPEVVLRPGDVLVLLGDAGQIRAAQDLLLGAAEEG